MNEKIETMERELQELKARSLADAALLHCVAIVLPTEQLRALERTYRKLAEELTVKFIYGPWSESSSQAVAAKCEHWRGVLTAELQAREKASHSYE